MTFVLGLGNVLMGDDGAGPAAVRAFEAEYLAGPEVVVFDLGTPGLDLTPWLADVDSVIIVDTIKSDLPPGSLRLYDKRDLLRHAPSARVSPHDPGVKEALLTLEFAERGPRDVALIGIVPERVGMDTTLSRAVQKAIPGAVDAIAAALERFGATVTRRSEPARDVPWWTLANV